MQDDGQRRAEARQHNHAVRRFRFHGGRHRQPVDQPMQRQPDGGAAPRKVRRLHRVSMPVALFVPMIVVVLGSAGFDLCRGLVERERIFWHVVVMEVKEPLEKEHEQETAHRTHDGHVDRMRVRQAVRHQVQQPDAQHDAGDQADGNLHAPMRQPHDQRDPTAQQRASDARQAIDRQQEYGVHGQISETGKYRLAAGNEQDPPRS